MVDETLSIVASEASAERAFDHVVSISQFHRIQASPGYRAAAGYCVDRLLDTCSDAQVIHYPAEAGVKFWQFPSFEEWSCAKGILRILCPSSLAGKLADFEDCPISLIQRSRATVPEGLTTELVYVGEGKNIGDYRKARGRIAVCDAHCPHEVYDAAVKARVAGIILYKHRPLPPLRKGSGVQGVRQYSSFWWDQKDLFGFVLTPESGDRLVSYLRSSESKKKPVRAWALVETETYAGTLEVVTSLIPGEETKEVVVVAHLCHPKPSAGDNASGVAALLETHRVLSVLVNKGDLPMPRYGIRFLIVPEMTGTFAFVSRERRIARRLLLGLNLDMVGQRQEVTGSTLCIEAPPISVPSFTPYLLEEVVGKAFSQGINPGGTGTLASVKMRATPFSGGSDHAILSDPTVGVPTPMLMQWPDKFYHTSGDTPDKVSPDVLRRTVIATCAYTYTCARASEEDLMHVTAVTGRGLRKRAIDEMGLFAGSEAAAWISPRDKQKVLLTHGRRALRSIGKLLPASGELKLMIEAEEKALTECVRREHALSLPPSGKSKSKRRRQRRRNLTPYANLIVRRLLPGPADARAALEEVSRTWKARYRRWTKKENKAYIMQMLALYWADGRRSIAQISRLIAAETGYTNPDFLRFYFDLLEHAGVVEIKPR